MNARSSLTAPRTLEVAALGESERRAMFALYERYYAGTSWALFSADLAAKDLVIVLRDESGTLKGFSTLSIYQRTFEGAPVRVMFSGDTVVDERQWGQQALAFMWLRLAGAIKARHPATPLYWLLISKGHRTYRYLPAFSRVFIPSPDDAERGPLYALRDFLARDRFGVNYDADAGVVRFPESRGHLRASYGGVPAAHRRLPAVDFFLRHNPGYACGDELVCLCELAPDCLKPIARRAFLAGMRS